MKLRCFFWKISDKNGGKMRQKYVSAVWYVCWYVNNTHNQFQYKPCKGFKNPDKLNNQPMFWIHHQHSLLILPPSLPKRPLNRTILSTISREISRRYAGGNINKKVKYSARFTVYSNKKKKCDRQKRMMTERCAVIKWRRRLQPYACRRK